MESTELIEPVASRRPDHEALGRPASAGLAIGLVVLALIVLSVLVFVVVPSAGAAGGCGGG